MYSEPGKFSVCVNNEYLSCWQYARQCFVLWHHAMSVCAAAYWNVYHTIKIFEVQVQIIHLSLSLNILLHPAIVLTFYWAMEHSQLFTEPWNIPNFFPPFRNSFFKLCVNWFRYWRRRFTSDISFQLTPSKIFCLIGHEIY